MTPLRSALGLVAAALLAGTALADGPYSPLKIIPLTGEGGWDYLSIDPASHRLFVAHATQVVVIDTQKDEVIGSIADTPGVHGVAIANNLGKLFVSAGKAGQVKVVDATSLKTVASVDVGRNPDCIQYDPATKEVWAFNGKDKTVSVINGTTNTVVATIPLDGKPEFAQIDAAAGKVYDCIDDKSEIAVIDAKTHTVTAIWPIAPGEGPSGLALDVAHHRLFIGTDELMVIMDSTSGKVVSTVKVGDGVDAAAFDAGTQYAFTSNGAPGTVSVVHEDSPDTYSTIQTLDTLKSARTMQVDPVSHKIYLAAAKFEPLPPNAPEHTRPKLIPGTLKILVFDLLK